MDNFFLSSSTSSSELAVTILFPQEMSASILILIADTNTVLHTQSRTVHYSIAHIPPRVCLQLSGLVTVRMLILFLAGNESGLGSMNSGRAKPVTSLIGSSFWPATAILNTVTCAQFLTQCS